METEPYPIEMLVKLLTKDLGQDKITSRTVRYYIAEGLLPQPDRHGQYTAKHLRRLKLIVRLKKKHTSLEQIKNLFQHRTDAQMEEWLEEIELEATTPAEYTAALIAKYARGDVRPPERSTISQKESWERILLAPGVELHYQTPVSHEAQEYIEKLITYAQTLHKPAR